MELTLIAGLFLGIFLILIRLNSKVTDLKREVHSQSMKLNWIIAHFDKQDQLKEATEEIRDSNEMLDQAIKDNTPDNK